MTEKYQEALGEQLKKNVWDTMQREAAHMGPLDKASLITDVTGIFDPTPVSDAAGLAIALAQGDPLGAFLSGVSMVPYLGDAIAKPLKIAKRAPATARAIEAVLKVSDELAHAGESALKAAGLSLAQVAAARKSALAQVQKAMLEVKQGIPGCQSCKLVDGNTKRRMIWPRSGERGAWATADGLPPASGTGAFTFANPKTLPDGTLVREIDYIDGVPNFEKYIVGEKHALWEVTGNVTKDEKSLIELMRTQQPGWKPPSGIDNVLHHFEDGTVGYVPRTIHDTLERGLSHTGGNSMINNQLF